MNERLAASLKNLPRYPGVYFLKNKLNRVLYIGKAKNLRNRVPWYFKNSSSTGPRLTALVSQVAEVEIFRTDNELEALILEANLIKEYRPRYNVALLDDKNYPFLKISTEEAVPGVSISRRRGKKGQYFGPFTGGGRVKSALKTLRDIFPLRICRNFRVQDRPCLEYQIKKCAGPCAGKISPADYRRLVDEAGLFLEGRHRELMEKMEQAMKILARSRDFEKAAGIRDQINSLKIILERQKAVLPISKNIDVLVMESSGNLILGQLVFIRAGRWVSQRNFSLKNPGGQPLADFLGTFLVQFYAGARFFPDLVLVNVRPAEKELVENFFKAKKGVTLEIRVPRSGIFRKIIDLSLANLKLASGPAREQVLSDLKNQLGLKHRPERIFGFDISNLGAEAMVGVLVVFYGGQPAKNEYRKFIIRELAGRPDDPAAMAETVRRGLGFKIKKNEPLPDLILVDGGRTQLAAAGRALAELGFEADLVALAKKEETIFTKNSSGVNLNRSAPALKLLQRVRDEAHRFAIAFHRRRRSRWLSEKK